tara:strand:+ start:406 stop:612 length:207 start_codon:yes stop_codon:yes gene_type:complete
MNTDIKNEKKDSDLFFNLAKSFNEVSSVASVYAKIMVLMDLKLHIQGKINELQEQAEKLDPLSKNSKE